MKGAGRESGISPVVGVILMVAVTVGLSAGVGVFVFDLGGNLSGGESTQTAVTIEEGNRGVSVQFVSLDGPAEVRYAGKIVANISPDDVGRTVVVRSASPGEHVTVVATPPDGKNRVIQTHEVQNNLRLIGYWKLNEGAGATTAVDESYYGNHGSLFSDVVPGEPGIAGTAYRFNQSTDCTSTNKCGVDLNSPESVRSVDDITITAWINTDHIEKTKNAIVYKQNSYMFWTAKDSSLRFTIQSDDGEWAAIKYFGEDPSFYNGTWRFVAAQYNSDTQEFTLYVDGQKVNTSTASFTGSTVPKRNNHDLRIGHGKNHVRPMDGRIDEVRVYNAILSKEEITAIYEQHATG